MIKETIKVIHEDNTVSYLYHAGPLRSHTLYGESIDLEKFCFKQQNYEGNYLESEKKRVSAVDGVISANIISIEVDSNYKFIKEIDNPLDIFERVHGLTTEQIIDSLSNEERFELANSILETDHPEAFGKLSKYGNYDAPPISFIYQSGQFFIGVDNRAHECFMEVFKKEFEALAWATDPEGEPL